MRPSNPDLLVVDKAPRGFGGELEAALCHVRERGTRTVLGLRDVLDDAVTTRKQWLADGSDAAVRTLYKGRPKRWLARWRKVGMHRVRFWWVTRA